METRRIEHILASSNNILLWNWDLRQDRFEVGYSQGFLNNELSDGVIKVADWEAHILPEDLAALQPIIAECREGVRSSYSALVRLCQSDGTQIWIQDQGWVTERDENGKALSLAGLHLDITHFKEIDKKLRTQQIHQDIAAHAAGMCFWTHDCAGDEIDFSEHFYEQYGYRRADLPEHLTQWWMERVHPDDLPNLRGTLLDYIANGIGQYDVESRMRDANGRYIWVRSTGCVVKRNKDGTAARLAGSLINIDQLKQTEANLQKTLTENRIISERLQREVLATEEHLRVSKKALKRHRLLLGTVTELAVKLFSARTTDLDEAIQYSLRSLGQNVHADRVYVLKHVEQSDESYLQMYREWQEDYSFSGVHWNLGARFDYRTFPGWEELLRQGQFINTHVSQLSGPARVFFDKLRVQSVLLIPVHVDNVFWGAVYFADSHKVRLSDEDELKALQSGSYLIVQAALRGEAVVHLKKAVDDAHSGTRAKTQFLANMSHEMRTPLNAISGLVSMARKPSANQQSCLDGIAVAADQLKSLIADVLEMARLTSDTFCVRHDKFTVTRVLDAVYANKAARALKKNQDFRVEADAVNQDFFYGDPALLELALNHLVGNAIEFTPDNGSIRLQASIKERDDTGCTLRFCVVDNGIGIEDAQLTRIFLPFEQGENTLTREHEGTGLGLAIVKRIADNTDSILEVESSPGKGSTFSLLVRLKKAPSETVEAMSEASSADENSDTQDTLAGKHVLIVDDNEINREILLTLLNDIRITADCAKNGQAALDLIREKPGTYSLVLMDIHMPVLDGYRASRAIRSLPDKTAATVPIVAVTANCFPEDLEKSKRAGMNGHIGKPIDYQNLRKILEACLGGRTDNEFFMAIT